MLIAIDLDEILAETLEGVILFHNKTYDTALSTKDFHSYRWWEVWGGTREEAVNKFLQFTKSDFFKKLLPFKDAVDAVSLLAQKHELIVLTSRQTELETETREWIKKYFPNKFKSVHVLNHADWATKGKTLTKKEVCKKLGVNVLIEDNLDYANECAAENVKAFLINYPWNKGECNKGVTRVNSWEEIVNNPIFKAE